MELSWEFSIIDLGVIVGIVVLAALFAISYYLTRQARYEGIDRKFFDERWIQIEGLIKTGKEMNYKLAVIEADKLLDHALSQLNFSGQTAAERLQIASYKHKELKHVWWAHKVRNMVVHEVKYELSSGEVKKVIAQFKSALKLLHCL